MPATLLLVLVPVLVPVLVLVLVLVRVRVLAAGVCLALRTPLPWMIGPLLK